MKAISLGVRLHEEHRDCIEEDLQEQLDPNFLFFENTYAPDEEIDQADIINQLHDYLRWGDSVALIFLGRCYIPMLLLVINNELFNLNCDVTYTAVKEAVSENTEK